VDEKTRAELLDLLARSNPRTRRTVLRVIEGKVGQDDIAFLQEQLSFVAPDLTVRNVDFVSIRLCSAGHVLGQEQHLVAQCSRCSAWTCSAPGCTRTCSSCNTLLCSACAHVYGADEAYCARCHPRAILRWLVLGSRRTMRGEGQTK
jgi:hypothetical protein